MMRDAAGVMWTVIIVAGLILLAGRLAYVWIRYRRIKADGHDVRWEWPLGRWWRGRKARR